MGTRGGHHPCTAQATPAGKSASQRKRGLSCAGLRLEPTKTGLSSVASLGLRAAARPPRPHTFRFNGVSTAKWPNGQNAFCPPHPITSHQPPIISIISIISVVLVISSSPSTTKWPGLVLMVLLLKQKKKIGSTVSTADRRQTSPRGWMLEIKSIKARTADAAKIKRPRLSIRPCRACRPHEATLAVPDKPSNHVELDPERFNGRQLTHGDERGMMSGVYVSSFMPSILETLMSSALCRPDAHRS